MKRWMLAAGVFALTAIALPFAAPIAHSEQPAAAVEQAKDKNPDDWLLNAPDDATRFKLIQSQARGFSASMFEVARRFETLYDAVADKNTDFAAYQLTKIKEVIEAGTTRRPKRKTNADAIFIGKAFEPALAAIKSGDAAKAWEGFAQVRAACMACHEAEKVGFMNNQPLFRKTEKPKE